MNNNWYFNDDDQLSNEVRRTKKKVQKIFIIALLSGLILLVVLPLYILKELAEDTLCANGIVERQGNSNESHDYVVFTRNCGATTGINYQLSIIKHGKELNNDTGNVLISDSPFTAEWIDETSLRITETEKSEHKRNNRLGKFKIRYE